MRRPRRAPPRRPEALAGLVLALAVASPASAFELQRTANGEPLRWDGVTTPRYAVAEELATELARAARWAYDTWGEHLGPGLAPEYAGLSRPSAPARDGESAVSAPARWPYGDARRLVAYTELHYVRTTGQLLEADVALNREGFRFAADEPGAMDPSSVLLHEVGHALGLAHSCGDPQSGTPSCFSLVEPDRTRILDAVMAPNLALGEEKRALAGDDLAGLRALYAEGFVEREALSLGSVERRCEDETWLVYGEDLPEGAEVSLRARDGRLLAMTVTQRTSAALEVEAVSSSTLAFDLVVYDPSSAARGVLYDARPVDPSCEPSPGPSEPAGDGGCDCAAATSGPRGDGGPLWLLLAGLGWAARGRRARAARGAAALAALCLLFFGVRPAEAYRCSRVDFDQGPSLYWEQRTVDFYIHERLVPDEAQNLLFRQEIITSLATWTEVGCSDLEFRVAGIRPVRPLFDQNGPNENAIVFVATGWAYSPGIIAVTTNTFETSTGRILDSDIEVNAQHFPLAVVDEAAGRCDPETGVMDLQNTMTHEVGHVVGLDHPPSTRAYAETTMFASAPSCETKKRTLSEDDVAGVCDIYPTGLPVAQCFPPNGPAFVVVETDDGFGGCTVSPGAREYADLTWLWLLLGLLFPRFGRRGGSKGAGRPS